MKRMKIAAVAACSALALFSCDQGLNVDGKNEAASNAGRWFQDSDYPDGIYDLYFRNGQHIFHDCDGYSSKPHGKTVIYEYWQSDIKEWGKLLSDAGIPHQIYKTSKAGKYCSVSFDSDYLYGVGLEGRGFYDNGEQSHEQLDIAIQGGKNLTFKKIPYAYFAPAHGEFFMGVISHKKDQAVLNKEQKDRDIPVLAIEILYYGKDYMESVAKDLKNAGAKVIKTQIVNGVLANSLYVLVDATSIDWFAIGA